MLSEQKNLSALYDNVLFNQNIKSYGINAEGQFALYPPLNAVVFLPLVSFEPLTAKKIWLIINVFLIIACSFLIKEITQWDFIRSINVLLITGFALANDLFLGQIYLLCTVLLLSGYLFFLRNKKIFSSLSWGILMALKYVPFIFFPVLVIKKKWKLLLGVLMTFIILHLVCLPFFGINLYEHFLKNTFISHLQGNLYEGNPYSIKYQSWESLLNNLFVYDNQFNPHPVFYFPGGYAVFKFIVYGLVFSTLVFFWFKSGKKNYFFEINVSLSVITLLILEPGSATYHNLFLILPFIIILKLLINTGQLSHQFYFSILFLLIGFLPTLLNKFDFFYGGNLLLSYNRLWLEMIFYFYSVFILYDFNNRILLKD